MSDIGSHDTAPSPPSKEHKDRYGTSFDWPSELVCRYRPDTTLTFVNEAYCRYFNRTRHQLLGKPFLELLPPEARGAARRHVESLRADPRTVVYAHEVILPDGSVRWQEWIDEAIYDLGGRVIEFQAVGRDITERKSAEQAVQQLKARLLQAQDEERRRIARELHEGPARDLLAIAHDASRLQQHLSSDDESARHLLAEIRALAEKALQELRTVASLPRPLLLDERRTAPTPRILIADDQEIVRRGIRDLLARVHADWEICAEAADGRAAVTLAQQHRPDVVVLALSMPVMNGLETIRQIREALPQTEVLVFSRHEGEEFVRDAFVAGARGYVLKSNGERELVAALEAVLRHETYYAAGTARRVLDLLRSRGRIERPVGPGGVGLLTRREREILQLLAEGKSNKQVAAALSIRVKTVETHRANIMRRLGLSSVVELVRYAVRNRLIDPT